jgi:hypothetical protein
LTVSQIIGAIVSMRSRTSAAMSKALGGWLGILFSMLLLAESQSGRAATISPNQPRYNVTSGPVACAGGVCIPTLQPPGVVNFGAAFISNNTSPNITALQTALAAVPGMIVFYGGSLDSITFNVTTYSASNNGTNGGATFVWDMTSTSSSLPANLHWDQWVTGTFNIIGNNPAAGAAKDVGNTIDGTFPAAASPFYDVFARGDPNAFATSPPHFEDSSKRSEPNPADPNINWVAHLFLVPSPSATENPANRASVSFYDGVQWGGTGGVQWGATDGVQWGGTDGVQFGGADGVQWGGTTTFAVPGPNVGGGLPGTRGAVSASWPRPWP